MSNWQSTVWKRRKDGMKVRVLSDSSHGHGGYDSLLVQNIASGRRFWVSRSGLGSRYVQIPLATIRTAP